MTAPPLSDERSATALLRLVAAQDVPAAGLFAGEGDACRLVAGNAALAALGGDAAGRAAGPRFAGPNARRVDPAAFGLAARFAAAVPLAAPAAGFLLVASALPRRLTAALRLRLSDAAALAGPILARAPQAAPAARRRFPRAAAQRLVEATMRALPAGDPAGLLMLDLDRFHAINEAMGVAAGDALLALTGTRIEQALGVGDRLLRLEGDRFAIVSPRSAGGLRVLARRLLKAVSQPVLLDGRSVVVRASIGIVTASAATPASALIQVDTALRRAKLEGRGRFVLHEPAEGARALERSRLELDLAEALALGQMHLAYQPFIDLRDGRVVGAEALLRWRHPTRGVLQPAAFIALAEATGLILPLGRWALRAAMQRAQGWPARIGLAVNISPLQFHQPDFLADVDFALAETGFPADRLELEITETVLMRDNPETTRQLRALIDRGIRIALDDFGTGYSALAYLARLPHHRIKLDKAFVQDLANPATADVIRAILALARAQGVAVTAEGVERPEHLAQVRRTGFTHAQGYATGVPMADFVPLPVAPAIQAVS
ncbi:bifunctional diguanylate cyclase/phosphodiesterase [Amaricoccus sp.]|uniref:putative bifunctional diguanylate cyclase/phosphodiesterase n=1 Tax=Amaricoccus sp. TaxID=1872485 RepID=UPI002602A24E|nr:bifunctional diguanylate cyclase/phosphodiesterase [Amaricoccus sp.]HRO10101.1 bifunctional diguanylate cyclase/phosphodiesterase [Amaricoccus sp.]